nr:15263_t:CDS:2 [Entrophospora candida]
MGKKTNKKNQQLNSTDNIIHKSPPTPPSSQASQTTLVNGNSTASDNSKKQHDKEIEPSAFKSNNNGKKSSKSNFLVNFFSWKKILLIYIFGVIFGCYEKKREECSEMGELFCFNGLSQYILKNDWFKHYVEPGIIRLNADAVVYTNKAHELIYPHYELHAKPHVDTYIEKSRPYLEHTKVWTTENVYSPTKDTLQKSFVKVGSLYNQHAKEHVNKYYYKTKDLLTIYISKVQIYVLKAYESSISFNNKKVQPFYRSEVKPRLIASKVKVVDFYNHKMVPFANQRVEDSKYLINKVIIPAYHDHAEPHILQVIKVVKEFIEKMKQQLAELTNPDDKKVAEKAAAKEAERKSKEEAKLAEKTRKEAAEQAEKKRKEAAEQAEKKRKEAEQAEKKRKEAEQAEAAAIIATKKSIHETTKNLLPILKQNLATLLKNYENNSIKLKTESENDIDSKVSTYKTFCDDQTSKIESVQDDKESTDFNEKIKQILKNVNERGRETIVGISLPLKAFNSKLNESDDQFRNDKSTQIEQTKSKIFETVKANNKKYVDDELTNFVQQEINTASVEVDQKFQKISSKINTNDKVIIEDKINSSNEKIKELSRQVLEFGKKVRNLIISRNNKEKSKVVDSTTPSSKTVNNKQEESETTPKSKVESPQLLVQSPDLVLKTGTNEK